MNTVPRTGGNFVRLLRGRTSAAVLTLASLALMARALPAPEFGLVMLLHSFVLGVRGLVNFNPFEAIVLYGTRHAERPARVEQLLRITLLVDLATVAAALVLAWLAAGWLSGPFGWSDAELALARGYSLIVLASPTGSANGVLRLYDRFDAIANHRVVAGVVLLIGCALSAGFGTGLTGFLVAQGLAYIGQHVYLQLAGWRVFCRHHPEARLAGPVFADRRRRFPGLGRFLLITYWQGNLDVFPKHLVVLGTGAVLDEAAAGIYRLAAQTTRVVSVPALLLRQVLFPDLARLWSSQRGEYDRLFRRALGLSIVFAVAFPVAAVAFGADLLALLFGDRYLAGATLLAWLTLAASLELITNVLRAGLYARGRAGRVLFGYATGVALHVAAFLPLAAVLGLDGTGVAAVLGGTVTLILSARVSRAGRPD